MAAKFMYPGESHPCHWETDGVDSNWGRVWIDDNSGNQPGDRRGVASLGPFTFEAGSTDYLDLVLVTAAATKEKPGNELLQDYVAQIKHDYLENPLEFGNQYLGFKDISIPNLPLIIHPNPVVGSAIWFELPETEKADYAIFSASGQLGQRGKLPAQENQKLELRNLYPGWYLIDVSTRNAIYHSKIIK
jgi:hypothetical protein